MRNSNYVKETVFHKETEQNPAVNITFYDDLGREYIQGSNGVNTKGNFVYSCTTYDKSGLVHKKWLPVVGSTMVMEPKIEFMAMSVQQYGDYGYESYSYDLLNRMKTTQKAGWYWHGNNLPKKQEFDYNMVRSGSSVKKYIYSNLQVIEESTPYASGELIIESTKDEDGHVTMSYKDILGNVVLQRRNGLDTYYVYSKGKLRVVIPPEYQESGNKDLLYQYLYDDYGRCCRKIIPGCHPISYMYDTNNHIVVSQDGLLFEKNKYRFYLYDCKGRLCVQGICDSLQFDSTKKVAVQYTPNANGIGDTGYSLLDANSLKNIHGLSVEIVNLYDDYIYQTKWTNIVNSNCFFERNLFDNTYAKGSITGQIVSTTDGKLLYNTFYYDQKGRIIDERHSTLDGDIYQITTEYSFTGKPVRTTKVLHYGQPDSYAIDTYYEYNEHNDQLEQVTVSQGGRNEIVSKVTYNDLGQIATESRANNADVVSYTYDLHGWTKTIASPFFEEELHYADAINGAVPRYNGDISALSWKTDGKKHGYGFTYDNRDMLTNAIYAEETDAGGISISQKYNESATYNDNGGITMLTRKGKTNSGLYDAIDMLNYEYDGNKVINISDRIRNHLSYKDAFEYNDKHRGTAAEPDFEYNSAGMLVKDLDKGISQIIYNNIGLVDSIRFSNGNKIRYIYAMTGEKLRVTHYTATPTIFPGRFDDEITDPITDRPSNVGNRVAATTDTSSNGIGSGVSRGEKEEVQELVMPLVKSSETFYIGDDLQLNPLTGRYTYLFGGGYCEFKPCAAYADSIKYYYYTKDHLGNVRNVISKNDSGTMEELQQTHYYPFGGIIADLSSGRDVQNRTYNAKEQDFANSLFWLDYGARQYDPTRGQFTTPDPLAEKYYPWNYYAYCVNNPVNAVDPDGRYVTFNDGSRFYVYWQNSFYDLTCFGKTANNELRYIKGDAVKATGLMKNVLDALNKMGRSKDKTIKKVFNTITSLESNYEHQIVQGGRGEHSVTSAQGRKTTTSLNMEVDASGFKGIGLTYYELVGHEMKHAYDFEMSLQSQRNELFEFPEASFGLDELSTCMFENLIRKEEGAKKRTAYKGVSFKRMTVYLEKLIGRQKNIRKKEYFSRFLTLMMK